MENLLPWQLQSITFVLRDLGDDALPWWVQTALNALNSPPAPAG